MPVGRGKQVSKEGAYLAMWLTSDTKFNEVILSIFLKRDDMQFWLYKIQSKDIFTKIYYFDSDTSRTRQVNEWGGSVLKLRDWRAIWNLTKLCEVSKNIFAFKTSNSRQTSERRGSVYNTWLRNDMKSNEEGRSLNNRWKYLDLDTSSTRQTNESWRSILKLCDWNLKWSLTQ